MVMHPRAYGIQFEMYAGTSGFAFLQNQRDGGQPVAIFNSLYQSFELLEVLLFQTITIKLK